MRRGDSDWSEERIETLKKLWAEGYSCSEIAKIMGGITRNAAIGKVTRLGLVMRGGMPGQKKRAPTHPELQALQAKPKAPPMRKVTTEPVPCGPVRDFPPAGYCRHIKDEVGGKSPWRCCGEKTSGILNPWCDFHLVVVSGTAPTRREWPAKPPEAEEAA